MLVERWGRFSCTSRPEAATVTVPVLRMWLCRRCNPAFADGQIYDNLPFFHILSTDFSVLGLPILAFFLISGSGGACFRHFRFGGGLSWQMHLRSLLRMHFSACFAVGVLRPACLPATSGGIPRPLLPFPFRLQWPLLPGWLLKPSRPLRTRFRDIPGAGV